MTVFTSVANAPRLVRAGGVCRRVPAATLADLAELVAFVEDHVPAPDGSPCAPFSSADAQAAVFGPVGLPLVVYLALSKLNPVTFAEAESIALGGDPAEVRAVLAAFFRRRPRADDGRPGGRARDLTAVAWGRQVHAVCEKNPGWTYADVLGLSLDQYDNLASGGKADDTWEGKELSLGDVMGLVGDAGRETEAEPAPTEPTPAPLPEEIAEAIKRLGGDNA